MSMINVKMNPDRMPTIFTMGLGAVVTGHVMHDGMPGLYFCPATKPGIVDSDAVSEVEGRPAPENAVIIRFVSVDAVIAHMQLLETMMRELERSTRKGQPDPPPAPAVDPAEG